MGQLEEKAVAIIKKIEYLTISTISTITSSGEPWGSPVYTDRKTICHRCGMNPLL